MTARISSILGNAYRLDGGAMFGNVPKPMWSKWMKMDSRNRLYMATRAMIVRKNDKNILFEAGIGCFFPPKLRERFGVYEDKNILLESLKSVGLSHEDLDFVVLSHLHFDHIGGILTDFEEGAKLKLLCPRAQFVVSTGAFERAENPHFRDRASFVPEFQELLKDSGRLHLLSSGHFAVNVSCSSRFESGSCAMDILGEGFTAHFSDGHTPAMLLAEVEHERGSVLFGGDAIAGVPWGHLPVVMGYDRYAEKMVDEKKRILEALVAKKGHVFLTHDPDVALATVVERKGKFSLENGLADDQVVDW